MTKRISLWVLILAASAAVAQVQHVPVVAKGKFLNKHASVTKAIFTPTQNSVYRVTVYLTVVTPGVPEPQTVWNAFLNWTDDAGDEGGPSGGAIAGQVSNATPPGASGHGEIIVESVAGSPIILGLTNAFPNDGSAVNLYYTVEQLVLF